MENRYGVSNETNCTFAQATEIIRMSNLYLINIELNAINAICIRMRIDPWCHKSSTHMNIEQFKYVQYVAM